MSEGGIELPQIAENVQDCEGIVLAVSSGPGYELPTWVADRLQYAFSGIGHDTGRTPVDFLQYLASQPREPRVAVGDRILFDVSLATQGPDAVDEYLIEGDAAFAIVTPGPRIELTSLPVDPAGYRLRG
jgi:co-chaperonin GroES (HSP10)